MSRSKISFPKCYFPPSFSTKWLDVTFMIKLTLFSLQRGCLSEVPANLFSLMSHHKLSSNKRPAVSLTSALSCSGPLDVLLPLLVPSVPLTNPILPSGLNSDAKCSMTYLLRLCTPMSLPTQPHPSGPP